MSVLKSLIAVERLVHGLLRVVALQLLERLSGDAAHDEAHLAEAPERDVRRVLLADLPVEVAVGRVRRDQVELGVHEQLVVPRATQRVGQEVRVARRRAAPLHAVLKALLLSGLEDLERLGRREVQDHAAPVAGGLHGLQRGGVGVLDRHVLLETRERQARVLGDELRAFLDVLGARHVRLHEDDLLHALADQRLRGSVGAVARAHVHRRDVRRRVAAGRDAGRDHVVVLRLVVLVVDVALDDARRPCDPEHLLALDELLGLRGRLAGVGLLGLDHVVDGVAVDAAVVVHALEVGLGHARDLGEVRSGLLGRQRAELDRRACGLLAGFGPAVRRGHRFLDRRAAATAAVVVVVATGGNEQRETGREREHEQRAAPGQTEHVPHDSPSSGGVPTCFSHTADARDLTPGAASLTHSAHTGQIV